MSRILIAALLAAAALLLGPQAAAEPRDWLPYCSGDQTPIDTNCKPMAYQVAIDDLGLTPGQPPVTGVG